MKKVMAACSVLALAGCGGIPGLDMMDPTGMMANSAMASANMTTQMAGTNFMAAQAAAERDAVRPGDDKLTCDQLQAEMGVMFDDPAFVSTVASLGAQAQSEMDRGKAQQSKMAATIATTTAIGAAASFIPGGGWLAQGAMQAQMAATAAEVGPASQRSAGMIGNMASIMPQMMRGQRINDLATAKKCAFLQQAPAAPG